MLKPTVRWPKITVEDKNAVLEVLDSSHWCRIHPQSKVAQFENAFAASHDAVFGIAVCNGTVSLQLCLKAGGVAPGDEVIAPAVSFIATASAITEVGAIPVFADIDPETIGLDPDSLQQAITPRTRAVIAVHYGGYPIDFDRILPIVRKHRLLLICDAAHAHGTEWNGKKIGAYGDFVSFSFQESKSITAGEGGMVLTNDPDLADKAKLIHNIGRALSGPTYIHHVLSSNYRMTELQGALLMSQMRHLPQWTDKKHRNGQYLASELSKIGGVAPLKRDPRITKRGYYFFVIRYNRAQFKGLARDKFVDALNAQGIPCGVGYGHPLYKNPAFKKENLKGIWPQGTRPIPDYERLHLPAAETFCARQQVTIPHTVLMEDRSFIQAIIDGIVQIKKNADTLA